MRLFAVVVALCMLSQAASAQMSECKSITDAGTRLACYDRIAATTGAAAKPTQRAAAAASRADGAANGDSIGSEDARMNAQLKNICRGC